MFVVRAIEQDDLPGVLALVSEAGSGMTTLKPERDALEERIGVARASFEGAIASQQRDYMFVLESTDSNELIGVSAIKVAVGLEEPFYNYRIGRLVHSSRELGIYSCKETLYLSNDLTGSAELCSLFLHPRYRNGINGKLLSKARLVFVAQFAGLFPERLMAEMRGFQRADGTSPFWESLGRHFFKIDFEHADYLSSLGKKSFIAELMPRYPLYVDYLTPEAREVIGKVHVDTAPAKRMLEQEGLHYEGYVDIFDAGPAVQARISELRALKESRLVQADVRDNAEQNGPLHLVATTGLATFRAIVVPCTTRDGRVGLTSEWARALHLAAGETVRVMPLQAGA